MGAREGGRSPNPEISTKTFYPTLHQSKPIAEKANTICYIEFFTQNFFGELHGMETSSSPRGYARDCEHC
jgi:hypothetical protein